MQRLLFAAFALVSSSLPASAATSAAALVRDAHTAYDHQDYSRALELYASAIRAGASKPTTFYNAACSAALAGQPNAAFAYLNQTIDAGYTKVDHLATDSDFVTLRGDRRWAALLARTRAAAASLATSLAEPALREELLAMRHDDLSLRLARRSSVDRRSTTKEMYEADAKRTVRLRTIVQQHGWPGRSRVGVDGAHAAWLVARHADDTQFQRRVLELMAAAGPGEVDPQDFAVLSDVVLIHEGKKQTYGTQFYRVKGRLEPRPIEDIAGVDERRKRLGLPRLAEYQKHLEERHTTAADSTGS